MTRILYLGSDLTHFRASQVQGEIVHYPVIETVPRALSQLSVYGQWSSYTHILVTSKNAVRVLFAHLAALGKDPLHPAKTWIAVGSVTAEHLQTRGVTHIEIASYETQEGVVALLHTIDLKKAFVFFPHSSLSRSVVEDHLKSAGALYVACPIYDTRYVSQEPKPYWPDFDQIVFTSPSTVQGCIAAFGALPHESLCCAIGPITAEALRKTRSLLEKQRE